MRRFHVGLVLVLMACDEPVSPDPVQVPGVDSAGAAAAPPTVSAAAPPPKTGANEESPDTWLLVKTGLGEAGVIEVRAGKPPVLAIEGDGGDASTLKATLDKIGGPKGIALDMHMPPEGGEGRGAYGTRIVTYDDPLYRFALTNALEPNFSVKPVTRLTDPLPPPNLKQLHVSRSGEKVGTLDFTGTPPKLTIHTDKADGDIMKRNWEHVQKLGALKVRYQHPQDSVETLVVVEAKPGDASYAQTVALYLMAEESYRTRYAYELTFAE